MVEDHCQLSRTTYKYYSHIFKMSDTNKRLIELLENGTSYNEICKELGISKSTISYHAKRLKLKRGQSFIRSLYDWDVIQAYYDEGYCLREVAIHFNLKYETVLDGSRRGKLKVDSRRRCKNTRAYLSEMFSENSSHRTCVIRYRIKKYDLLPYYCHNSECPLYKKESIWAGKAVVLHLDHINGINNDHRLENLRWLCPNCHSQTETYCGKNTLLERSKKKNN
jgi:transposase